jgi:hypothetical protein
MNDNGFCIEEGPAELSVFFRLARCQNHEPSHTALREYATGYSLAFDR